MTKNKSRACLGCFILTVADQFSRNEFAGVSHRLWNKTSSVINSYLCMSHKSSAVMTVPEKRWGTGGNAGSLWNITCHSAAPLVFLLCRLGLFCAGSVRIWWAVHPVSSSARISRQHKVIVPVFREVNLPKRDVIQYHSGRTSQTTNLWPCWKCRITSLRMTFK